MDKYTSILKKFHTFVGSIDRTYHCLTNISSPNRSILSDYRTQHCDSILLFENILQSTTISFLYALYTPPWRCEKLIEFTLCVVECFLKNGKITQNVHMFFLFDIFHQFIFNGSWFCCDKYLIIQIDHFTDDYSMFYFYFIFLLFFIDVRMRSCVEMEYQFCWIVLIFQRCFHSKCFFNKQIWLNLFSICWILWIAQFTVPEQWWIISSTEVGWMD